LWFGIHLVRQLLIVLAPTAAPSLSGWASTFNFIFAVFLTIVTFGWVRRHLLWRVRNRLIVTYIFIGVIPVVLILGMVGISGYLFSNQYATSQARVEFDAEVRALDLTTATVATRLAEGAAKTPGSTADLKFLSERFPGLQIEAWRNGKPVPGTEEAPLKPPAWMKDSFKGVVNDGGKLYIRTLSTYKAGANQATVLASVPVSKELLDRTMADLGEVKFHTGAKTDNSSRMDFRSAPAVTGGTVPKRSSSFWDPELTLGTYSPYRDWTTGDEAIGGLVVNTRLSALIARLFANTGKFSSAALVVLIVIGGFFAMIELVAIFFGIGLTRTITSSVYNLYQATQHINRGDLKFRINVKNTDQLASLQIAFNSMAQNLEKLIAEQKEKERLENELAIAQEVQETLFPKESVEIKSLELHGVCRPARTVSGDYYDFLPCGQDQLGIALGDISGKGISAALLMATIHSAVRAYEYGRMPQKAEFIHAGAAEISGAHSLGGGRDLAVSSGMQSPASVLELLNRHLFNSTQAEKYATLFLGVYEGDKRTLTYSNAGHLPPFIIQEDGSVSRLEIGGTVIGLFDGMIYEEGSVALSTNDIFVAFSDGITEPENEFGEFGEEKLIEIVRANRHLPLAKISEIVIAAVQDWIGSAEQPDDVTLVLARVR
jgi:sigma-B regulation protein RsbU (phosphoserine phosphatase)